MAGLATHGMVNLGGGLGVAYVGAEHPPTIDEYVAAKVDAVRDVMGEGVRILDEPGRALVANSTVTLYTVQSVKRNVDLYVAVDGGMSDNLRPMLYGARYEAQIASRFGGGTYCHLVGKHCESGDLIVRDAELADPRPGDVVVTPATGAYGYAMANTYNGVPRAPVVMVARRRRAARRAPRDLRGADRARCLSPSASACSATAPSARRSRSCCRRAAAEVEAITGLRPELRGVLTRSRGDFEEILAGCDLVVELMGGLDPARDYVLRAMAAGKHVVTANKQLLSQHGEELWAAAREHGVQLRFEAAVAGVVPVIRVLQESLAAAHVERLHGIVNGTTNFILTRMAETGASYDDALAEAQRLGYAEADPTEDVNGKDAAAKMAILARLAFNTPVHLDQVLYEGIEHITADDMEYARELGLGLKLIGTAERVDGGLSVRVHPAFLYGGHPLASVNGPVQRRDDRVAGDHRDHAERARRRRPADGQRRARRRHQRDDPAGLDAGDHRPPGDRHRRRVGLLPAPRGRRPPRRARPDRPAARAAGRLDPLGRAEGAGRERAPGDGHPPDPRVALLRGDGPDRRAGLHALAAAGDPRHRRGVRLMAGLIERYRDRLPFAADDPVVSLHEGSTPLVPAPRLSERGRASRCG